MALLIPIYSGLVSENKPFLQCSRTLRVPSSAVIPTFLLGLFLFTSAYAQEIEVFLPDRTMEDDLTSHVKALVPRPTENLKLPAVDTTGAWYQEIFYSWDVGGNCYVTALVRPDKRGQTFYIDLNNDEDLTNDGEPLYFPYDQNELVFDLRSGTDPEQRTRSVLQRIPRWVERDTVAGKFFRKEELDEAGNLSWKYKMFWSEHNPGMTGLKNTFFFDQYLNVSRGTIELDGISRLIGLMDYNLDGLFNGTEHPVRKDFSDLLIVDINRDGLLTRFEPLAEVYKLNDVFELGGKRYRLTYVDPYGRSLRLMETDEPVTEYYLKEREALREESGARVRARSELDDSFWNLELTPIDGPLLRMADLKGRYILLNFWGEWCAPCIEEIPVLTAARRERSEKNLTIISLLKTDDLPAARRVMEEKGITWPQVLLTEELAQRFKVSGYPTNLLILPDGGAYLVAWGLSSSFFEQYVNR